MVVNDTSTFAKNSNVRICEPIDCLDGGPKYYNGLVVDIKNNTEKGSILVIDVDTDYIFLSNLFVMPEKWHPAEVIE